MKANLQDTTISRLFDLALTRMRNNRISPSPNSIGRGEYRCAFSEEVFFSHGLNSENVLILLNTDTRNVDVLSVSPMLLRRIREFLLYDGDYVVLYNDLMPSVQYATWHYITQMSYTARQLSSDSKYVFDMREWVGDVKIALTGDWCREAVHEIEHGKLDIDYAVSILTYLWDVKVSPIRLYYSACYTTRVGNSEVFGFQLTPNRSDWQAYFDRFRSRYTNRYGCDPKILEEGVLEYDNIRDMYEALTPTLTRINSIQELGGTLDFSVGVGLRIFNPSHNRFLFRWENF